MEDRFTVLLVEIGHNDNHFYLIDSYELTETHAFVIDLVVKMMKF